MIAAFRNFSMAERNLRAGHWKNGLASADANGLTGRTLAILGLGGIGYRMAELVQTFPMRIIYHSRHPVSKAPPSWEYFGPESMDAFLAMADVLSIHVPLNDETKGMVDEKMIRKLKKGSIIVNTARGKVIDEEAMIRALDDRHVRGSDTSGRRNFSLRRCDSQLGAVGLDVFATEPSVDPRLISLPNATLLPHVGTLAQDCMLEMEVRALTNIQDYLEKGVGRDIVPELIDF
jgi:glyoxylate reductase